LDIFDNLINRGHNYIGIENIEVDRKMERYEDDDRLYPSLPVVGVGVVVVRDGRLLMIRRSKEPGKGKWSIPGGRLELGETIFEGARREAAEETSIDVNVKRFLDTTETIIRENGGRVRYHYVLIDLVGEYISGEPEAGSDAGECRWVDLEEVPELDMPGSLKAVLERNDIIKQRL
jgi:ADP-ribose pyrophosphatase